MAKNRRYSGKARNSGHGKHRRKPKPVKINKNQAINLDDNAIISLNLNADFYTNVNDYLNNKEFLRELFIQGSNGSRYRKKVLR